MCTLKLCFLVNNNQEECRGLVSYKYNQEYEFETVYRNKSPFKAVGVHDKRFT